MSSYYFTINLLILSSTETLHPPDKALGESETALWKAKTRSSDLLRLVVWRSEEKETYSQQQGERNTWRVAGNVIISRGSHSRLQGLAAESWLCLLSRHDQRQRVRKEKHKCVCDLNWWQHLTRAAYVQEKKETWNQATTGGPLAAQTHCGMLWGRTRSFVRRSHTQTSLH